MRQSARAEHLLQRTSASRTGVRQTPSGWQSRDSQPYMYELMASDVLAVMNTLRLEKAALVGWSDGACTAHFLLPA
jgi:pimeloyl-ACP methyl ester carboxylesterase